MRSARRPSCAGASSSRWSPRAAARRSAGRSGGLGGLWLLRQNLLEMLLDTEAATTVVLNAAAVFDGWDAGSAEDRKLFRLLTPLAKYWTTMRARWVAS